MSPPSDRVWPDGKTCKQKAAEERQAARHAGLEESLTAYAAAADPVLQQIEALRAALAEHAAAGQRVQEAAGGRIAEAERLAADPASPIRTPAARTAVADRGSGQAADEDLRKIIGSIRPLG